ncbi:unnamed protein product [Caenorhabditis auriculariae]|uniref:Uncharacterized protein n=1 Tax=Caenorhabditis auriculariae TaxID=2777116 RepID=A0A8S1HCX8_9PELO|nr:unnamed protein product [Caenorhabditis auriculariae]
MTNTRLHAAVVHSGEWILAIIGHFIRDGNETRKEGQKSEERPLKGQLTDKNVEPKSLEEQVEKTDSEKWNGQAAHGLCSLVYVALLVDLDHGKEAYFLSFLYSL